MASASALGVAGGGGGEPSQVTAEQLLHPPSEKETTAYFARLLPRLSSQLEVRADADGAGGRGKGLFVREGCSVAAGAVLFKERPLSSMQHASSCAENLCCAHCYRYVGGLAAQISRRLRNAGYAATKLDLHDGVVERCVRRMPDAIACSGGCDNVYCSERCRRDAKDTHHALMCLGEQADRLPDEADALQGLLELADSTSDHIKLAARIIATTVAAASRELEGDGVSADAALLTAWEPYRHGVKAPWWDTAAMTDAASGMSREDFEKEVRALALESLDLLKRAFSSPAKLYPSLFSIDVWSSLLGMLDQNCLAIKVGCPLREYFDGVLALDPAADPGAEAAKADAGQLWELLPDAYDAFCDGTGFFAVQSVTNHDCDPNAMSTKTREADGDGQMTLRARRSIEAGEEVTISYVETSLPVSERRLALRRAYGFQCTCARCMRDAPPGAPDCGAGETSSKRSRVA